MLRRWLIPGALAILLLGISPAAAGAATPAASMIASAAPLTVGASEAGGGAHIDFWQMQLAGGDQVTVDFTGSSSNEYTFQLYAPGTTDATFSQLPAADTASTNGNSPDQITLQAPYTGNFVLAVCQNTGDCRDVLTGSGVNPMTPYTFTTTLPGGGITPAAATAETRATGTIDPAAPLTVGAFQAGGGGHVDLWQMQLAGGDQVTVDFTGSSSNEYTFQLYAPGTTDATFSQLPAADTASTNGNSPDQITLQAPYTGNFVLAVCQNTGDCRDVLTGSGVNPMTPYTFTTTLPGGGITPAATAAETRATGTIDPAAPLTVGAFEAGGGGHADFWQMQLTGGSLVTLDFDSSSSNEYTFQLYAPGTTDATFSQAPAAVSAGTNGSSPDQITLQAPYTGNFVLAVCQNTGDCRDVLTGSGVNPMTPYTFTTAVPAPPVPIPPTPVPTLPVKGGGTSPPPVAPPPTASLRIARQTATVTATGRLAVRLTCAGAPCTGSIRLAAVVTTTTGTGRRRKTHTKTQTLGTAAFSKLAVGSHAVEVDLGAAGLAALRHHGYRLKSTATATYRSGSKTRKTTGAVSLTGTRPTRR